MVWSLFEDIKPHSNLHSIVSTLMTTYRFLREATKTVETVQMGAQLDLESSVVLVENKYASMREKCH